MIRCPGAGAAIRSFLQSVCDNRKIVENGVREARGYSTNKLQYKDASGEVYRVASRFSLVAAAGLLATDFGITKCERSDVIKCVEGMFDEWLESRGTMGASDAAQRAKQVLAFIAQHGSSRFQSLTDSFMRVPNRAGFRRENVNGQSEYLILSDIFEGVICRGYSAISVARELRKLGRLKQAEGKNLARKERLPELGRTRVYTIAYDNDSDTDAESENN
ncbi:MAG: hypothetical protein WKF92_15280 [Pyrinomonadaceae bacterium]